jgi:hypothetical protein
MVVVRIGFCLEVANTIYARASGNKESRAAGRRTAVTARNRTIQIMLFHIFSLIGPLSALESGYAKEADQYRLTSVQRTTQIPAYLRDL